MIWQRRFWIGFVFLAGAAVACGGRPPNAVAPSPPAAAESAPAATTSSGDSATPPSASSTLSAAGSRGASDVSPPAAAPTAVPEASVLSICHAKCAKLASKCSTAQVESCRLNCTKYDPPPAGCEESVRAALQCARDAPDLTCAHVAPETCAGKFREIAACAAGEATPKSTGDKPTARALPEGWERVSDAAAGFSLTMPRGSTEKAGPEGPVRSVTAPDGTIYTVSVLPLLKEKPSEKSLLHFLMKVQGRCSDKVKLDGFIEKADRASIHFTAHCPDKTDWNGMIYINQKNLIMLSAQAAVGKIGPTEPFFYQFDFAQR